MHLKYIKLLILKIRFILGLCNFKFSFKILPPPPPQKIRNKTKQENYFPTTIQPPLQKKILTLPANTFLKFLTPPPPPHTHTHTSWMGVHATTVLCLEGIHPQFSLYILTYTLFKSYHLHGLPL